MSLPADVATLKADVANIKEGMRIRDERVEAMFSEINERLKAGDRRFREADVAHAEERGMRRATMFIGTLVLTAAGGVGMWVLGLLPGAIKWIATRGS